MSSVHWLALTAAFTCTAAAAAPGEITLCRRESQDLVMSYQKVDGFRQGENFIREFQRKAPDSPIAPPVYVETLRFNGDDAHYTYEYQLPDGTKPAPAAADDLVHVFGGRTEWGITGFLKTHWEREPKTVMAYLRCNALQAPGGDCRIDFDDSRRLGTEWGQGPAVALFLDGATPRDICIEGVGLITAEFSSWWLTLDGVKQTAVTTACAGPELAAAFVAAKTVEAAMVASGDYRNGETLTATIGAPDIQAAIDFSVYLRGLVYQPTPEKTAWLKALVDASKAAFAAAGDDLRACTVQEPPT
jgi:hypothetical protein